jgi:CheY-like chemotaxis protein
MPGIAPWFAHGTDRGWASLSRTDGTLPALSNAGNVVGAPRRRTAKRLRPRRASTVTWLFDSLAGNIDEHRTGVKAPDQLAERERIVLSPQCATSAHHPPGRKRLRLIVVDDNADAGNSLGVLLRISGHEALVFQSGQDALDALEAFAPDAMILDLAMPGMDGFELARRVRARSGWERLPLIAVTANSMDEDQRAAKAAGVDHHFVKASPIESLLRTLGSLQ